MNVKQIDTFANQSDDFRFATAVLGFGQLLKQSKYIQNMDFEQVLEMANNAKGSDDFVYRGEFVQLVRSAQILLPTAATSQQKLSLNELASEVVSTLQHKTIANITFFMVNQPGDLGVAKVN